MWSTLRSTARRRTARAAAGSRGGPTTPGPASCMAPKPMRPIGLLPRKEVLFTGHILLLTTGYELWQVRHRGQAASSSNYPSPSVRDGVRQESQAGPDIAHLDDDHPALVGGAGHRSRGGRGGFRLALGNRSP